MSQPEKSKKPINKENFVIHEILISRKGGNIYDVVQWTNIHLTGVKKSILIFITVVLRYGSFNGYP